MKCSFGQGSAGRGNVQATRTLGEAGQGGRQAECAGVAHAALGQPRCSSKVFSSARTCKWQGSSKPLAKACKGSPGCGIRHLLPLPTLGASSWSAGARARNSVSVSMHSAAAAACNQHAVALRPQQGCHASSWSAAAAGGTGGPRGAPTHPGSAAGGTAARRRPGFPRDPPAAWRAGSRKLSKPRPRPGAACRSGAGGRGASGGAGA